MKTRLAPVISAMLVLVGPFALSAVYAADPAWSFDHHGEITASYRFMDVAGYQPKYEELFNLRKGFRISDFIVRGGAREKAASFADAYTISATGLGGDPATTAQLVAGKTGLYDLRATWRQSAYYVNRNDNVVLPITAAAPTLSRGLTGNHDWTTVRKAGSVDLTIHATNNLRFILDISRSSTDGLTRTTRSLDYFNSPSFWQSFARANPYPFDAPLDDRANRFAGGVDYTWRSWNLHYVTGYQSISEDMRLSLVSAGETSINPVTLSQSEPLNTVAWSQTRKLISPVSEFAFVGSPRRDLEWRGSYIYAHYHGPAGLSAAFSGVAPSNSANVLAPYTLNETASSDIRESVHVATQGFMWRARPWLALDVGYRYSRQSSDSQGSVQSVFNGGAPSIGPDDVVWKSGISDLALVAVVTPAPALVMRPGIRLTKTDIEMAENGVIDVPRTRRIKRAQPEFRFGYTPNSMFSLRGMVTNTVSNVAYTPITPHTRTSGSVTLRIQPVANLSIENSFNASNSALIDSRYRSNIRIGAVTFSYVWNERISLFGAFNYDTYYAEGEIEYARGTPPSSFLRDQEIHRVWQAGLDVKPFHSVGFRASGNYDRLTGAGVIDGEPPAYGPLRWPLATATLYYDCARVGRVSVDLSRSYYIEELVTADNFSANLLTVRFTRAF